MSRDHCGVMKAWEATVRKTQAAAKKRASSFFGTNSVAHAEDDEESVSHSNSHNNSLPPKNPEVYHSERVLPNADYYTGQWSDSFPHGMGKYIWTDGCMYIGEWWVGKTNGRGRFTWPSGATYEGEFKSGYMDGRGVYMGANRDMFKGNWVMNLKHGDGFQSYANGDSYDGEWSRGFQEGHGKYQWRNGNYYVGEWKNGVINGKGNFFWCNGNRFDGFWEDGFPKGTGTLWFSDGSFYMGNWSKDCNEQSGSYYPSGSSAEEGENPDWDPQQLFSDLSDSEVCQSEKVSILPSQKKLAVWRSSKGADPSAKPKRMSVDSRLNDADMMFDKMHMFESDGDGGADCRTSNVYDSLTGLLAEGVDFSGLPLQKMRVPKAAKRPGETISKGHRNYELMLNLQLGIRHSVGRPAPAASLDLKASAFDPKQKVWTRFPPEGSKYTPPHQSCDFRWKDYCPLVFRTLRKLFKVDAADYMISICGNDALRELSSPGKSGSFFYLTNDDRYMIKTMKKSEVKVLLRMLSAYYNHVRAFENTMLIKFYGLHCVKVTGTAQKKVRFIIMGNLFCSNYTIHRRFDLKGSSLGRTTCKSEAEIDDSTILKDLDLNFIFRMQKSWFQEFCRQVDRDCEFLEQERIMDYSLLVGIHFMETSSAGELLPSGTQTPTGDSEGCLAPSISSAVVDQLMDPSRWSTKRLGFNMPARVERTVRRNDSECQLVGDPTGELYDVVIFFGIIDILQDYDISKKLEHAYKSFQYDPASISAVDPRQYSKRFRDFLLAIFHEDD